MVCACGAKKLCTSNPTKKYIRQRRGGGPENLEKIQPKSKRVTGGKIKIMRGQKRKNPP